MKKPVFFSVLLILLSYIFFSFSYRGNKFAQKTNLASSIIGKWVGKFSIFTINEPYINQYWELTNDNRILVYSTTNVPKQFSDYEGRWTLEGNVFKATFTKSNDPSFVFTDLATLSNDHSRMEGVEAYGLNTISGSRFFMEKL